MPVLETKLAPGSIAAFAVMLLTGSNVYAETYIVEIENFQFTPHKISIQPGDTVVWKNLDIVPHTATDINNGWDTGHIDAGSSVTLRFDDLDSGDYFCEYHPNMKAQLVKSD